MTPRTPPNGYTTGLFLVSCGLLAFELLLTRLFSVALLYHFAFFAVSIALFGLGAAGIFIQCFPRWFSEEALPNQLSVFCIASSLTLILSPLLLLRVKIPLDLFLDLSGRALAVLAFLFLLSAVPFFFGGLVVTSLFKRFPAAIGKLYFADLLGAGAGCLSALLFLELFGAPTAVLLTAVSLALGGLFFLLPGRSLRQTNPFAVAVLLTLTFLFGLIGYNRITSGLELKFAKGSDRSHDEFSKWNAISRVAVFDCATIYPAEILARGAWGMSASFRGEFPEVKCIDIDAQAMTLLTRFDGDWRSVNYVIHDPASIVHRLKENPETLVIGAGGGKDVLAALSLGARHVTAVELNPVIVEDIMLGKYRDFTGGLYQHPRVTAVVAEGRSYVQRQKKTFDIIQLAFVDTSAATATGAYALAENNLYTVEAFTDYLSHLKEDGILSVSWIDVPGLYGGTRLVSLGLAALERLGVPKPEQHLLVFSHPSRPFWMIRNVLVKRSPFTDQEIDAVAALCREFGFLPTYLPGRPQSPETFLTRLIRHPNRKELYRSLPIDISPTTDDRPFFFYQERIGRLFDFLRESRLVLIYGVGLQVLSRTLATTLILVLVFFLGPVCFLYRRGGPSKTALLPDAFPYLMYGLCVGVGFMFLEIALLQRFVLFLGHPFHALSTVLISILLFAALGSLLTQKVSRPSRPFIGGVLLLLAVIVGVYQWGLPRLFETFLGYPTWEKAGLTVLCLMPVGCLMGMPLPLGLQAASRRMGEVIPWIWGLNGGASVLGSVVAMILAMNFGYTVTLLAGAGVYLLALLTVRFF